MSRVCRLLCPLIVAAMFLATVLAAPQPKHDYDALEGERHHLVQSREHLQRRYAYEVARRKVKERRKQAVKSTANLRSQWLAANVQCLLRNGTSIEEAQRVLTWLCDADGGAHSCHGIKEGGSHYNPLNPKDHLEWAMTSFHESLEESESHGHRTCWYGGIAYMLPAPVNEWFLELSASSSSGGRLVQSRGQDLFGSQNVNVLKAGESVVFEARNCNAVADRLRKHATFEIHVAGEVTGAVLTAELSFDFDGDGKYDRRETFHEHIVRIHLNDTAYQWRSKGKVEGEASFLDLENGSLRLRLSNVGSEECQLQGSTEISPSHLRIPYFPY